jgi:hypothetical protein
MAKLRDYLGNSNTPFRVYCRKWGNKKEKHLLLSVVAEA